MIGALDDVLLYDRALSEAEIRYLAGERATPVDPGTDGLVAYYPLDIDALDASGNGNDGTINGDPQWVDGKVGGALEMDGGDFVDVPGAADINPESITLATWVYFNEVDPAVMERQDYLSRGDDYAFSLHEWNANQMIHGIVTSAGGWSVVPGSTVVEPQIWYHTAMTYDVDTQMLILYLDGEVDGELSLPDGLEHRLGGSLTIGTYSGRDLLGRIDETVIYDRALSAGEIRYLAGFRPMVDPGTEGLAAAYYFDADATDSSGNGYDGTLLGDAHVADGLLVLDGDDDAVDIPRIGGADATFSQLTYSMMVYPTVDQTPLQFSGGLNTNDWNSGAVHIKLNNGWINVGINGLAGGDLVGTTVVLPDMWSHLALTVSETEVALYLNGVLEDSRALDAPLTNLIVGGGVLGAWNNGGDIQREMTGMMDDVLIYDRALSAAEILYLANN
jgi:hypothetical protein